MDIFSMPHVPQRTQLFNRVLVSWGLSFLLLLTSGCDKKKPDETPEPTVPWKKEERPGKGSERQLAVFEIAPNQSLEFDLPTRRSKPGGKLWGISGNLNIDLQKLEASSGELAVDLRRLEFVVPPLKPAAKKKAAKDVDEPRARGIEDWDSIDWSGEARRWLYLGSKVSAAERDRAALARFTIHSLRDLSHPGASSGARLSSKSAEGLEIRQVRVTAIGELSWRGLSVHREVPLVLRFQFESPLSDGSTPVALEVGLHGNLLVPLAEYEIEPRDEAGHSQSNEQKLIGQVVGSNTRIRGELQLVPSR